MKATAFLVVKSNPATKLINFLSLAVVTEKSYGMQRLAYHSPTTPQAFFRTIDECAEYAERVLKSYGYELEIEYDNFVAYTSLNILDVSKSYNFEYYIKSIDY